MNEGLLEQIDVENGCTRLGVLNGTNAVQYVFLYDGREMEWVSF